MADSKATVDTPCSEYTSMRSDWPLIDALMSGTQRMRAESTTWLPKEEKESEIAYRIRLNRSILYEAYNDTVEDLADKPFVKPVSLQAELPEALADIRLNCDGEGTNLTQFARQLFATCINRGLTHVLVDYPKVQVSDNGRKMTLKDEKNLGLRPYFVHITPDNLIGWRYIIMNGKKLLTEIRWRDYRWESEGLYDEKIIEQIRIYRPDSWELHEKIEKGKDFVLTASGLHTYRAGVPLVTCYIKKTGFMTGRPPLRKLAWLNLAHYQSYSDQRHLLRFVRFPLLFMKGLSSEEMVKDIVVGASCSFKSTNPDADGKYIEHTGAGAEAGRQDIKDLEERMEVLGLQPLLKRSGNITATGEAINEARSDSSMQSWVRSLEGCLAECYRIAGNWINQELSDDFNIDIFNDFGFSVRASEDIKNLILMRQAGELSRETFLREVRKRALLSETVDVNEEIDAIQAEGPALAAIGQ